MNRPPCCKSSFRAFRHAVPGLLLIGLMACTSVPFDYPRTESHSSPPDPDTPLGRFALQWQQKNNDYSGFIGLGDGSVALGARLRMMTAAQGSIDAQYFILKKDRAGALFVGKMLLAADRGVRVRLLIDDIFSPGIDSHLTLLDSHPNIEVRIFNPVSRNSQRYWSYLLDFRRANRRMHNKSFTVDGSLSIVGGRNIGEEYFELKQDVLFDDYEVLAVGPVVRQIGIGFDMYWNSPLSVPVAAFGRKVDTGKLEEWRASIQGEADASASGLYAQAVNSEFLTEVSEQRISPVVAEAVMISDSPDKLLGDANDPHLATLAREKARRFREAHREVLIVSPYFIPQETGMAMIEQLLDEGVRVIVVTNSLASTNHVPVHAHYTRYRERLLRAGASIYEIRAESTRGDTAWGHRPEMMTLHTKASVIDEETIFIGSFNFDPRSIKHNTEMGLFIETGADGKAFADAIKGEIVRVAYQVQLDDDGDLRWTYRGEGAAVTVDREPDASWRRRFLAGFYRLLPIEDQL